MMIIQIIYDKSPIFIQHLMCSIKGFLIKRKRFNKNFKKYLNLYESNLIDKELELRCFLHDIKDVPYYKTLFLENNFDINAVDIYKEIKKLPILTKNEVKKHLDDIINKSYKGEVYTINTSGTTGGGLIFPCSRDMENRRFAVCWRFRRKYGIQLDMWCAWFGGRTIISPKNTKPPYWRINYPGKQCMFSSYHLNIKTVDFYYNQIKCKEYKWLHGYPSQISLLSSLILEKGLQPLLSVKYITFSSENLLNNQIQVISRAFPNALLRQHYGLTEGVAKISQSLEGDWIVEEDFAYVEFIPIEEDATKCKIVGTGFSNRAFPLVRYDTGDIVEVEYLSNNSIKIISIDGRKEDFITLPNGVKLGRLDHIFKDMLNIIEAQIHQISLYEVEFKIVKASAYTNKDEEKLLNEIKSRLGDEISITLVYVDKIPRTKSGKLRLVISDI